ncbi:MAG: bacillithiol biosynthesis deacetylase BshB1 [Planctomycetota bacterium]
MSEEIPEQAVPCDIVAFVAHPDDAELYVGGTLALAKEQGHRTAIVDFTRGELSTRGNLESRAAETAAASRTLGLSCRVNLDLPDGHLRDNDESRLAVVKTLREMRPSVVLASPIDDHHADHMAAGIIVKRSVYLSGVRKYGPTDLEPWRPNTLLHYVGTHAAVPDCIVDISSVFETRDAAIRCYQSQFFGADSTSVGNPRTELGDGGQQSTRIALPEFMEWMNGRARHFGMLIGASYGEAFTSDHPIPISRPVDIFGRSAWENR